MTFATVNPATGETLERYEPHSDAEVDHLKGLGADVVIMGEREIARGMIEELERRYPDAAEQSRRAAAGAPI